MKKFFAMALALALVLTSMVMPAVAETEVTAPETITIMCDTTVVSEANGRADFEAQWEALIQEKYGVKIDLVIIQPDHSAYADVLQQTMVDRNSWPDVMILPSTLYSSYAAANALWDMSAAWDASATKNSGRFFGDAVIEGLKIDGKLFGFSPTSGNGCVTYVKKAWLDNVGIEKVPTTWDEYAEMLDAFANGDPDGNGKDGDTYGVSAAGFVGSEAPYTNYLAEFYQDAYPSFILKDGKYVDGFTEESMKGALERLAMGFEYGWIDPTTLTNATKDCRNMFYDNKFGAFTYWAGNWAQNLKNNLEAKNVDSVLIPMAPIAEVGKYFDRVPPVWAITRECDNPEGVFKYFIDTMLDGGDIQMLWTYGAEDVHWSRKAETVLDVAYAEGEFHMRENLETAGTAYTKNHIDPKLALANFAEGYDAPNQMTDVMAESADVFNANSKLAAIVPTTTEMSELNGDLTALKNELIANVAMGKMTYDEAMAQFNADPTGAAASQKIVDSLNAYLAEQAAKAAE
ncbi:MAG: ABC transporter substrate-binding protein [Clostridia bacterium]|nr:ABC transporter substrate-binding protein [Clostridia bacterium]